MESGLYGGYVLIGVDQIKWASFDVREIRGRSGGVYVPPFGKATMTLRFPRCSLCKNKIKWLSPLSSGTSHEFN